MRKLFILLVALLVINFIKAQNVGIGIVSPHALLHLHQASFPTLLFTNSTTGSLGSDGTALLQDGNNFILDNAENGSTIFSNNQAERMRITATGNVGIGTATPALAQLQVEGMVGNTVAMFKGSSGSKGISFVADWPGIFFNSYFNGGVKAMSASGYSSFINTEQSTGALTFNTTDVPNTVANDPVTVPERMRIAGNGYVGIGTNTPNYHLQLHNSASNVTSLQITNNAGGSTIFDGALITQENDDLNIENLEGAGKINLKNGGVPRMTITSTGLIGINQLNPISPLDVSGPIRINDGNQGVGKVLTSDALGNGSWKGGVACSAGNGGGQNINDTLTGGIKTVIFKNEIYDDGGNNYDPLTGIFTAPADGIYHCDAQVSLYKYSGNSPGNVWLGIFKNNVYFSDAKFTSDDFVTLIISMDVKLIAGDNIRFIAANNTGDNFLIWPFDGRTRMNIHWVK